MLLNLRFVIASSVHDPAAFAAGTTTTVIQVPDAVPLPVQDELLNISLQKVASPLALQLSGLKPQSDMPGCKS